MTRFCWLILSCACSLPGGAAFSFVAASKVINARCVRSRPGSRRLKDRPSLLSLSLLPTSAQTALTKTGAMVNNASILRWAVYGILTELFHNIIVRNVRRFAKSEAQAAAQFKLRQPARSEIAVVTGSTGGIGSCIARLLAFKGYDVVLCARDENAANRIMADIRLALKDSLVDGPIEPPSVYFVEYHADDERSALQVASRVKEISIETNSKLSVLVNNAGIMGHSKQATIKVNLLGPVFLTFALLALLEESERAVVVNVGSSAHLRATGVVEDLGDPSGPSVSWVDALPTTADEDLSTYAKSKLAIMQFSMLLRHWLPTRTHVHVVDAHPGLVWTPLLRNHIGDKAVGTLTKTGLAKLLYKTPNEGAQAIVAAVDDVPSDTEPSKREQVYYENGRAGGLASTESRSIDQSKELWKTVIAPEVSSVDLPPGWGQQNGL